MQGYYCALQEVRQINHGGAANAADYFSRHTNNMHKEINTLEMETKYFIDVIMQNCLPTVLTSKEIQHVMNNDPQMQALS